MKKILTLILIFSLTIQIFATQDKLEKSVGSIETIMKYKSEKATILAPFLLNLFLTLGIGSILCPRRLYWWWRSAWISVIRRNTLHSWKYSWPYR